MSRRLSIDFIDERYDADPDDTITFGRRARVVIDEDNPYLHRIAGSFVHHGDTWWLRNDGSQVVLEVVAHDGRRSTLPPGSLEPLVGAAGAVRFAAGASSYELTYELEPDETTTPDATSTEAEGTATLDFGVVPINDDQRRMLTALAEARLRDPAAPAGALPANAEVAHRLGWSLKKFDRKLDYLCGRLSSKGVPGLRGVKGVEAVDRRERLVDHALRAGLVTQADLALLDTALD